MGPTMLDFLTKKDDLSKPLPWGANPLDVLKRQQARDRAKFNATPNGGGTAGWNERLRAAPALMDKQMADQQSVLRGASSGEIPYTDEEKAAADQKVRAFRGAASASMPGSSSDSMGIWSPFFQFHENAAALAQGRGNRYTVNVPTETVVRGAGGQTMGAGNMGDSMDADAYGPTDPFGDKARMRKNLGLDMLAAQLAGQRFNNEGSDIRNQGDIIANRRAATMADAADEQFSRARALPREGTPDWYNRQDTQARTAADTNMDIADVGASRDARRYFLPEVSRMRQDQNRTALDRAVLPAQVAAGSRNYVADRGYQGDRYKADASRKSPAEVFGAFMDDLAKTYGQDPRTGAAQLPANAAGLRDSIVNQGVQAMAPGGGRQGGPGGAQDVLSDPAIQAQVQTARRAGWSDDEIRQYLSGR